MVAEQSILLEKIHSEKNPAGMMTNVVTIEMLEFCVGLDNMDSN